MTQLIGAICDKRTKILFLSDRQVERAGLVFEREPKGIVIAQNAMALTAGTAHEPEITESVRRIYLKASPPPSLLVIERSLVTKYQEIRQIRLTDEILRPRGFNSIGDFYSQQKNLHDSLVFDLNSAIKDYDLGLFILVGGIDEQGPHLFHVINPGTATDYTPIGFSCPGTGREQAETTFVAYNFSPDISVDEALRIGFLAKERARMAGGVGVATDAWIIDQGGVHEVDQETLKQVQRYWKRRKLLF